MKFSYNWVKELSGTKKSAEEIAELFLTHSFEVEGIEDLSKGLDKVVVGEVLGVEKHPDADRLKVARVRVKDEIPLNPPLQKGEATDNPPLQKGEATGNSSLEKGEEQGVLQIVCGAPNLKVGQLVPVALVGAKLTAKDKNGQEQEFEIKKSKIRGVESSGMICAEDELGIGDNHKGIMVIENEAEVGQRFAEYMNLDDKILDIDILPNRGHDCLSYRGIVQELNALESVKNVEVVENAVNDEQSDRISKVIERLQRNEVDTAGDLEVKIDTENCSRYAGVKIKNIKLAPSPLWMQARLKASGLKPINNIVDITNYVMLETGQPLHAFSSQGGSVSGWDASKIVIRQAKEGEKIVLLDEQELELTKDDIVITDGENPIALAGVMGGLESGIKDDTKEIILEGANFNSSSIRFTARRYNLQTDAAYRFERDIDPNFVDIALNRAVELIQELAGGEVETIADVYPEPVKPWTINLSLDYVRRLLGVEISDEEIKNILERLGIQCEDLDVGRLSCTIPTRRRDLRTEEDLVEEVGRIYGYDKIRPRPIQAPVQTPHRNEQRFLERDLKSIAVQSGFSEIRSYSFHSEEDAKVLGLDNLKHIELLNPASPEQLMLRNTLAVGLLKAGRKSLSYFPEVRIFEIGKVYRAVDKVLPEEVVCFGGAVFSKNKDGEQFYELKGLVDNLLQGLGIEDYYYDPTSPNRLRGASPSEKGTIYEALNLHPSRRAIIKTESGEVIGWLGETTKQENKYFGLKNVRGALVSLSVEKILKLSQEKNSFRPLPKFPFVERDLSMIVPERMRVKEVEDALFKAGGQLLKDVDLFDLYYNKETGERSMAFHLLFGDEEKTLQAKEVDTEVAKIIRVTEKELDVEVRK